MWNIPKHTLEQMADGLFIRSGVLESLMNYKTPFGRLTPPLRLRKKESMRYSGPWIGVKTSFLVPFGHQFL
jgi:hypothetical protein